jgi:hypothetical protein
LKVDKRFARGLQFLAHYTFSHANNYTDTYYAINHDVAWGPVDFNRNHVFVINTVYELPFGKGRTYMGGAGKALNYVIGGWQLSNTTNWSSGLPWTPTTSECGSEEDVNVCRPNSGPGSFNVGAGDFNPITHTVPFFTPLATQNPNGTFTSNLLAGPTGGFGLPGSGQLGNIGRNSFHGPRGFYSDLSVVKVFPIGEKLRAQFRMDAFNVFNHPVYAFSANNGANPCIDCGGGNNGKITGLEGGTTMRQLQFAIRFDF